MSYAARSGRRLANRSEDRNGTQRRDAGTNEAIGLVVVDVRKLPSNRSRRVDVTEAHSLEANRTVTERRRADDPHKKDVEGTMPEVHFYEQRQPAWSTFKRLMRYVPTCSAQTSQEWRTKILVAIVSTEFFFRTVLPRRNERERSVIQRFGSGINSTQKKTLRISEG